MNLQFRQCLLWLETNQLDEKNPREAKPSRYWGKNHFTDLFFPTIAVFVVNAVQYWAFLIAALIAWCSTRVPSEPLPTGLLPDSGIRLRV